MQEKIDLHKAQQVEDLEKAKEQITKEISELKNEKH